MDFIKEAEDMDMLSMTEGQLNTPELLEAYETKKKELFKPKK
jgi:hypothetical protein